MTAISYPEPGTIYGSWVVLSPSTTNAGGRAVKCRCSCGFEAVIVARQLRRGKSTRCVRCAHAGLQVHPHVGQLTSLLWNQILTGANVRGIPVSVTQDEAWEAYQQQQGLCALSGVPLKIAQVASRRTETTASLDRRDSSLGYAPGNIQWVHKAVNRMKGAMLESEFVELCRAVALHRSPR